MNPASLRALCRGLELDGQTEAAGALRQAADEIAQLRARLVAAKALADHVSLFLFYDRRLCEACDEGCDAPCTCLEPDRKKDDMEKGLRAWRALAGETEKGGV